MKHLIINLKEHYDLEGGELTVYVMDTPFDQAVPFKRPGIIVVPGGGYEYVSKREAEPIAIDYMHYGFQAFVLKYKCEGTVYPEHLKELACAIDYIKKHSEEFNVDKDNMFGVGFSAGGHLLASVATNASITEKYAPGLDFKLNAITLSYPVINAYAGHEWSINELLKKFKTKELLDEASVDLNVTEDSTPAYIWATRTDESVPIKNSILYYKALKKAKVKTKLTIFPYGPHGLSNAQKELNPTQPNYPKCCESWMKKSVKFMKTFLK